MSAERFSDISVQKRPMAGAGMMRKNADTAVRAVFLTVQHQQKHINEP